MSESAGSRGRKSPTRAAATTAAAAAATARGSTRSSPRSRAGAASRSPAQLTPAPLPVTPPVPAAAPVPVPVALRSEQKVDEAQVQAAFGAHSHHGSAIQVDVAEAVGGDAMGSDAASLQSLAHHQDEHRRKLEQLQWQARQQAHLAQQLQLQEQAERQDRMQQIQQKLHERIQLKQLHGSGSPSPVANGSANATGNTNASATLSTAAAQQMRQAIIRQEEHELTQSLAEHQIQLYKAMMHDLEMQSGVTMAAAAPLSSLSPSAPPAELVPAPVLPASTLDATTTKAYEDFQRARREQLLRLQQYQLEKSKQHGTGAVESPSVRTQVMATDEAMRQQLLAEQERLRIMQQRQQQQTAAAMHSRESSIVSPQEQLLMQQHDILRQQQILQGLFQRQQLERQQQQQAAGRVQQPQQQAQQKAAAGKKTAAPMLSSAEGALPPPPAKKRKKATTSPESQMEALVRELIRLNGASSVIEIRTGLDKMTAWVHRCLDVELLKFAQRDFRDIVLAKRSSLLQTNQWTMDIQVKCEYINEKIGQLVMAISVQQTAKAQESSPAAATSASDQSNAIRLAAKEHAYAALKAQMQQQQQQKCSKQGASASAAAKATSSRGGGDKKKQSLFVDLSLINPKQKAAAGTTAPQPQQQQEAPNTTTTETSSASVANPAAATPASASASAPVSTKPVKAIASQPKSSPAVTAAPLSPQLVQQLYDVDLSTRSCSGTLDEGEDKFYIPVKSIVKVMRRALPADHPSSGTSASAAVKTDTTATAAAPDAGSGDGGDNEEKQSGTATAKDEQNEDGDEEMKAGDEEGKEGKSSSTPLSSISLTALALQKRKELVERNLQQLQSRQTPIKIEDEAVAFMQECVTEFILYLTSEAKDHCALDDKKKTASLLGNHVVQGMENLGFSTYARVLDTFNSKIKKLQDAQTQKRVEKKLQDKKQKQQQKLLEAAAAKAAAAQAAAQAIAEDNGGQGQAQAAAVAAAATGVPGVVTTTEAVGAKPETTTSAVTSTADLSSQSELELMAREDLDRRAA